MPPLRRGREGIVERPKNAEVETETLKNKRLHIDEVIAPKNGMLTMSLNKEI